jgi:hypothetical protein
MEALQPPINITDIEHIQAGQRAIEMAIEVAIEAAACSMRMLELARMQLQRARQDKAVPTFKEGGCQTH